MNFLRMDEKQQSNSNLAPVAGRIGIRTAAFLAVSVLLVMLSSTPRLVSQVVLNNLTVGSTTGTQWTAAAINPVTNKLYVSNNADNTVSVVDLSSNTIVILTVGTAPQAVALNVSLNKIYVADFGSADIAVIDGATNSVTRIPLAAGAQPVALIVNPFTNKIFVGDFANKNLVVIDGATASVVTTVSTGTFFDGIAIDPTINKIYAVGGGFGLLIVDGVTYASTAVTVGSSPQSVAANPISHKIYVANGGGTASIVDGITHAVKSVAAGSNPYGVAIDPVTNRAYIGNYGDNTFTEIDGVTDTATQIPSISGTTHPSAVAVNSATGEVYFPYRFLGSGNGFAVVDESTNRARLVNGGGYGEAAAANQVTNRFYMVNRGTPATVTVVNGSVNTTSLPVSTGGAPVAIVEDPVNNRVYAINSGSNTVTPIVEMPLAAGADIAVGSNPVAGVADPFSGTLFVANAGDGTNPSTVSAVSNGTATSIPVGVNPAAIAIDLARNAVYVANSGSNGSNGSVTAIDTASSTTKTIAMSGAPQGLAVNSSTNLIYVTIRTGNSVSVIDGSSGTVSGSISVGAAPGPVGVNPSTNQVYVVNTGSNNISQIDGSTNLVSTIAVGTNPVALAVNPLTNKIYVANNGSNNLSVIDGTTATVTTIAVGTAPSAVWVNIASNQIYVANSGSKTVTVIDGLTGKAASVTVGNGPSAVTVNPANDVIFVANATDKTVTAISPGSISVIPLTTKVSGVPDAQTVISAGGFVTRNASPSLQVQVTSSYTSTPAYSFYPSASNPVPSAVYYQVGSTSGAWQTATGGTNGLFSISLSNMSLGPHVAYVYAAYGNEGGSSNAGTSNNANFSANSVEAGNVVALYFNVKTLGASTTTLSSSATQITVGTPVALTATVSSATGVPSGTVTFSQGGTALGTATLNSSGIATYNASLPVGSDVISAAYSGDTSFGGSTSKSVTVVVNPGHTATTATLTISTGTIQAGKAVTLTAAISSSTGVPTGNVTFFAGSTALGSAALNASGVAVLSSSTLAIGSYSIAASYTGDSSFAPSMSSAVSLTITKGSTTTLLSSSATEAIVGQPVTFTATISPINATGTVQFVNGSTTLGQGTINSQGTASFSTTSLSIGTYIVVATYSGDASYSNSTSAAILLVVHPLPTATSATLLVSSASIVSGQSVTLTANIVAQTITASNPTGTVAFMKGASVIGSATLNAFDEATLTTASLAVGSNGITAVYVGDASFVGSTSGLATVNVTAPVATFSLAATPSSLTVSSGGTGQTTITVSPVNGYKGAITLSCSNLPLAMNCVFAPGTVTTDGTDTPQTTALTVSTLQTAALQNPFSVTNGRETLLAMPASCGLLALVLFGRKRLGKYAAYFGLLLAMVIGGLALNGCAVKSAEVPSGNYTVLVKGQGLTTQSFNLTIHIQ